MISFTISQNRPWIFNYHSYQAGFRGMQIVRERWKIFFFLFNGYLRCLTICRTCFLEELFIIVWVFLNNPFLLCEVRNLTYIWTVKNEFWVVITPVFVGRFFNFFVFELGYSVVYFVSRKLNFDSILWVVITLVFINLFADFLYFYD